MFWLLKKILIAAYKGLLNVKYKNIINISTSKAHETNVQWTFGTKIKLQLQKSINHNHL